MSGTEHLPSEGELDEIAAEWLLERGEGFAPGRAQAFADWRNGDPRHAAAVARIERTLALLDEMPAVRTPLEQRFGRGDARPGPARTSGRRVVPFSLGRWGTGIAAACVVGVALWWAATGSAPIRERHATDAGAPRRVALADGSVVDMNANSSLRVQLTSHARRVLLDAGEAHFQVAHDTSRPFVVTAGGVSVRAVGTAFSVRLDSQEVDVLVVEGKVELTRESEPVAQVDSAGAPLLRAGERTAVSRTDATARLQIEKLAPDSVHALLAWQDRMTSFTDVPLREIVARFNRCNEKQLVIGDRDLGEFKFGGVIALDQVDLFVRLLEQDGDIMAERNAGGEIVLRRAR